MVNDFNSENTGRMDFSKAFIAQLRGRYRADRPIKNTVKSDYLTETGEEFATKNDVKSQKNEEGLSFQEWTEKYHQ